MPHASDPEKSEVRHLIAACPLQGKKVLDVGCGDGEFTWQFAALPRVVFSIDPSFPDLQTAKKTRPAACQHVHLAAANGEAPPFPDGSFDVVALTSSL